MGGRYHTAQVYLSGHGALKSGGADGLAAFSCIGAVAIDSFRMLLTTLLTGLSFFSEGVVGAVDDMAAALKSKAVPGVLGVLAAEPKEANAPEPSPKADEPPVVGDASPPGVNGGMALKGFRPPWEESPPKRLVAETVRWCGSDLSLFSECDMERESLLVLERRVQRFSLLSIGSSGKWVNNTKEEEEEEEQRAIQKRLGRGRVKASCMRARGPRANVRVKRAGCDLRWFWSWCGRRLCGRMDDVMVQKNVEKTECVGSLSYLAE